MKHYLHLGLSTSWPAGYIYSTKVTFLANSKYIISGKSPVREIDAYYSDIHQLAVL